MTTDLLTHISDDSYHASVLSHHCQTISVGPVKASFCFDTSPIAVAVDVSIFGISIAHCAMSNAHPSCTIGGSSHGVKAELVLTLDIPTKTLHYALTVCLPFVGCTTKKGIIPV